MHGDILWTNSSRNGKNINTIGDYVKDKGKETQEMAQNVCRNIYVIPQVGISRRFHRYKVGFLPGLS